MEIINHTVINLIIFVLAIYVGYHVVWSNQLWQHRHLDARGDKRADSAARIMSRYPLLKASWSTSLTF